MFKEIEKDNVNPGKREAVHVAIYNRGEKLYSKCKIPKTNPDLSIPTLLFINRWDGKIGFPGGHIESGETRLSALARELREEINFELNPMKAEYISSLEGPTTNLHFYCYEIDSFSEMKNICRSAISAEHFGVEITGTFLQHLANYPNNQGFASFYERSNFVPVVKEQLIQLTKHLKNKIFLPF